MNVPSERSRIIHSCRYISEHTLWAVELNKYLLDKLLPQ